MQNLDKLERKFSQFLHDCYKQSNDPAHDIPHTKRVVNNAKLLANGSEADLSVVIPAAWLHDCVILPKNHPGRSRASILAAEKAGVFLTSLNYPPGKVKQVCHAIESHSFSGGINPQTTEAKIIQDADRLDALGAIGLARCLMTGGKLGRPLYHPEDPFCDNRPPEDKKWTVDHFYAKLLKLPETMQTAPGKIEALKRVAILEEYLEQLAAEIKNQ